MPDRGARRLREDPRHHRGPSPRNCFDREKDESRVQRCPRLDRKLASIAAGRYTPDDFVIADAKDADMAFGVTSAGRCQPGGRGPGRYRTRESYLDAMRDLSPRATSTSC